MRPCLAMQASTTERTDEEEVASLCMTVLLCEGFSERNCIAAFSAVGREVSQLKMIAP